MPLICSYKPDYFSVKDILCTQERLPCKIEVTFPRLGSVDPSSISEDLEVGSKLELPVWLASAICKINPTYISVDIPKIYKIFYRDILRADASVVTLSRWSPFYYELGMYLRKFQNAENDVITNTLSQIFKTRFRVILDWAQNPTSDASLSGKLPLLEREIFEVSRRNQIQLDNWLSKGTGSIAASEVAQNFRKRKRIDFELD